MGQQVAQLHDIYDDDDDDDDVRLKSDFLQLWKHFSLPCVINIIWQLRLVGDHDTSEIIFMHTYRKLILKLLHKSRNAYTFYVYFLYSKLF